MTTGKSKDHYGSSSLNDDASYISKIGTNGLKGLSKVEESSAMTSSEKMAHREAQFVQSLRLGLFLVLLAASAIAAGCVYWYLAKIEQAEFEQSFHDLSTKLTEEFHRAAERTLGIIAAFSNSITVNMIATNATWPFVTIPKFESQMYHVSELANSISTAFAPILEEDERKDWEDVFVPQNVNKWVHESLMYPQSYGGYVNETLLSYQMKPAVVVNRTIASLGYFTTLKRQPQELGEYDDVPTSSGPYMPIWQVSPFVPGQGEGFINVDLNIDPTIDRNVISILREHKAALGKYTKQAYSEVFGNGNPTSVFFHPVLKGLSRTSPVGAGLGTIITWLQFFSNILPESAVGMIGVLSNTCNQSFTFRVDGAIPTFVGDDDLHESKYDHLKEEVSFLSLINDSFDNKEYLGLPLDETGCTYSLRIYPSRDLHSQYVTNRPIVASVVVLLIFILTSSLFVMYDRLVERRQQLVQKEAKSSGAIISSLFPAAYRERLMAAQLSKENEANIHRRNNGVDEGTNTLDNPIADLYHECTVFFADIAGFTKWSATRDPVQVFSLLQGIFAAMDKVAKKFGVFKVETIGDCYMAVTGLPNPQTNHAQLMSRFATECLIQMLETVTSLAEILGDNTAQLSLRIGLHSGPVTAGILRGEKSRFQLFGDTVNTASRMESTGVEGRIQVSNATADILRQAGKGHWLQTREDLVEAKGKGTMQTYWLVADRGSTCSMSANEIDIGDRNITENVGNA